MSKTYLTAENVDDLGRMTMALLAELWIVRDRVAVLEQLLIDRGGLTADEVDDYVPTGAFAVQLETLRDRMANAVVGAPIAAEERGVDQILARAGLTRPHPVTA
ncbi:hypothetical protein [Caulobacter sp.]|uniref:hypothetical protein n=1 Tax=Caulobacter sp. TaxID=78 RepID=UPI003BAB9E28